MRSLSFSYPFITLLPVVFYFYYLIVLSCFRPLSISILSKKTALLLDFNSCVTDRRMDGRTDGHTLLQRCEIASKKKLSQIFWPDFETITSGIHAITRELQSTRYFTGIHVFKVGMKSTKKNLILYSIFLKLYDSCSFQVLSMKQNTIESLQGFHPL